MTRARKAVETAIATVLPAGGGEMGALLREHAWTKTPLGDPDRWPLSLQTVVRILLTSRYAMWMGWGPDLTFLYNDAYSPTLGVKHPSSLGKPAREVWAEIWGDIGPRIQTVLDTGVATWDEGLLLILERSGYPEETYHTFSYSPVPDDSGAAVGMLCVVTEETERVLGERRLASLRELAAELGATKREDDVYRAVGRALRENQKDLPFTLTYLFDDTGAHARLACRTGIGAGHALGPAMLDVAAGNGPWPAARLLELAVPIVVDLPEPRDDIPAGAWDKPARRAVVVPIPDRGQERPAGFFVAAINPYRPFDTEYAGFVNLVAGQIASGLGNARAHEAERQRAEGLAELDRAKTTFFSNVSHEFRTPLTLLLGPLEDVLRDATLASAPHDALTLAHRNGLRLLKLVNALLDFSRIEAGRIDAHYEPTDLAAFTRELASSFRSMCDRAGITLVVDAEPLPLSVYVDRDMWEKIVLNLLSNAFKHTFSGTIAVSLRADVDRVILDVRDTGVGIAEDQLPRIFERFHRVPNARSRTHEGTGIGLALVQELVRRHGGRIDVSSDVGIGTTFTVAIPFGHAHLPPDHVHPESAADRRPIAGAIPGYVAEVARWVDDTEAATLDGSLDAAPSADIATAAPVVPAHILVADDNADMRGYVTRLLRGNGWHVDAVGDGLAAFDAALARRPDLLVSDVMMPRMDGFTLLKTLRGDERTAAIPIILLSARAGEDARVEGAQAGADDYLVKPFSAQELVARVGAQLTLARERARTTVALERARDLLTQVFEQAPVAICVVRGPDLVFELANTFYQRLLRPGVTIIGHPLREVIPEAVAQGHIVRFEDVYRTGQPWVGRGVPLLYDRRGDGTVDTAYFNTLLYPLTDTDGSISGVIAVSTEVTDEIIANRAAEAARNDAEEARLAAEAANHAKSQFLAMMSHELRTPLNAIAGHVQLLDMEIHGPIGAAQRDALSRIERSQRHLLGLINDILNLARIETGRLEYHLDDVMVQQVVAELAPMIEPQLADKSLRYVVELPETPLVVRADREKLAQIFLNLLSNAVKFTPPGGRVCVDRIPSDRSGIVVIRVRDTGIGIPLDKRDVIFEPFVQAHAGRTRTTEGAGLGLTISRDLARGMGGDLEVQDAAEGGAAFLVSLVAAGAAALGD